MSDWRNGLFECCSSGGDCCCACLCPCFHAYIAAQSANQGLTMAVLQCLCYPLLVPIMRCQARRTRGIDGNIIGDLITGWCCPCCVNII